MRGFQQQATASITLTRGDESIELTVHAVPPGFKSWLRARFAPPMIHVGGGKGPTTPQADPSKKAEYDDLFGLLIMAKGLEPSGVLEHKIDWSKSRSSQDWRAEAQAILDECHAAHLTDHDVNEILFKTLTVGKEDIEARGK
jgi:hypothetical protein